MPGQERNEPFVLKHRLTGAAILIAFAVLVLPLLLGGPDGGDQQGAGDDTDTTVFHSSITPIGGATPTAQQRAAAGEAAGADDERVDGATPAVSTAAKAEDETRTASVDRENPPQPGDKAATDKSTTQSTGDAGQSTGSAGTKTVERGWIVQVGVFKNPDNVKKLVAKLADGGIESSTSDVETSEGDATRVFVGPFETRVEAARSNVRVKQRTGSEGLIVAYP
jgi:DedD protein